MNLVIPTYEKHFQYNVNFIKTFNKYCLDKDDVNIYFILDSHNIGLFAEKMQDFKSNNIKIVSLGTLRDLLIGDEKESWVNGNKFGHQSVKKLLASLLIKDDYLVLDSENLCLKDFYMKDIFKSLKDKPLLSTINLYQDTQLKVQENCATILTFLTDKWYFIKSYWFYEYHIVKEMIDYLREDRNDLFTYLKNQVIFEYQLYCQYAEQHELKEIIEVEELLTFDINKLLYEKKCNFEHICSAINYENIDWYCELLKKLDERIVRLHWMDEKHKDYIIKNTNVCIGTFHWD